MSEKIFWTADEYRAIARELAPMYPKAPIDGYCPGLNISHLNAAIRKALPTNRQRKMANQAHIQSFERRLRDAMAGKPIWTAEQFAEHERERQGTAPQAEAVPNSRVLWNAAEWDDLIGILYRLDPLLEARFDRLNLAQLNNAAQMMTRPRRFFSVAATRRHLDLARARVKANKPESPFDPPQTGTITADKLFAKIHWTDDEWVQIAAELHRMYPVENYPYRGNLVGLETADVAFAQERVLPLLRQRRHLRVASFTTLKGALERAFVRLRERLEAPPAPSRPVLIATGAPTEPPTATPLNPVLAERPTLAPTPAPTVAPALAALPPGLADPALAPLFQAAFAPLVQLLAGAVADEVAKRLTPTLNAMLADAMAAAAPVVPPAASAPTAAPTAAPSAAPTTPPVSLAGLAGATAAAPAKHYGDEKPHQDKPKKLTVGVLVNRASQYKAELERTFPMLEIKIGDVTSNNAAEKAAHADKCIAMIRFVDHVASNRLKKLAGERYTDCNGGMSELKRIISTWLHTQRAALDKAA